MKGYILRGQGVGPMHDKVYTSWPTDEQFKEALRYELDRHGVVFEQVEGEADERGAPIVAKTRERWVRVQEVEIVGIAADDVPVPPGARRQMVGTIDARAMNRQLEEARRAPPGTQAASPPAIAMSGTGTVSNPPAKTKE